MTREAGEDTIHESAEQRGLRFQAAEQVHGAQAQAAANSFAPLVAMGTEILKAVALINGGAGVATLGFLAAAHRDSPALALAMVWPLGLFGFGLTVAACATGWSYFSQASYAEALRGQDFTWTAPYLADSAASGAARQRGDRYRGLAQGAVMVGIASAVIGFSLAGAILLTMLR